MARSLIADEFAEIRARREDLARERDAAISGATPPIEFSGDDVIEIYAGVARTAAGWWGLRCDHPRGPFDTAEEAAQAELPAEWLSPEAAERNQSHERFAAQEIDELAKLLGRPALAGPLACAFDCVAGGSIECVRGPGGFVVSAHGLSLGPYHDLEIAMKAVRVFLDLGTRK